VIDWVMLVSLLVLQVAPGPAPERARSESRPNAGAFDSNRAWEHLRQLVSIGPRPSGSAAIEQTRTYIKDQLAAVGLTAIEQKWVDATPAGQLAMVNLIATIPGTSKTRIAIAGHYDTKR